MEKLDFEIIHIYQPVEKNYQVITDDSAEMWAKRIAELARNGAQLGNCGKMCSDCAFKHPQPLTQDYLNAVDGSVRILLMAGVFNCHTEDHEDAGRKCAGMEYANQYLETQE